MEEAREEVYPGLVEVDGLDGPGRPAAGAVEAACPEVEAAEESQPRGHQRLNPLQLQPQQKKNRKPQRLPQRPSQHQPTRGISILGPHRIPNRQQPTGARPAAEQDPVQRRKKATPPLMWSTPPTRTPSSGVKAVSQPFPHLHQANPDSQHRQAVTVIPTTLTTTLIHSG